MSFLKDLHNEGDLLPVKAHTKMLAEQFLAGKYECVDHKTTSSNSYFLMKTTLNDAYRDRLTQHTSQEEQLNCKEYKNAHKISIDRQSILN